MKCEGQLLKGLASEEDARGRGHARHAERGDCIHEGERAVRAVFSTGSTPVVIIGRTRTGHWKTAVAP